MKITQHLGSSSIPLFESNLNKDTISSDKLAINERYTILHSKTEFNAKAFHSITKSKIIPPHALSSQRVVDILMQESVRSSEKMDNMRQDLLKEAIKENNILAKNSTQKDFSEVISLIKK